MSCPNLRLLLVFLFLESPSFISSQCKAINRTIKLFWHPPPSAVDSYYLETDIYSGATGSHEKEQCETVKLPLGATCSYSLECLHYGSRVVARVRASNRAGEGPFSQEISINTDQGEASELCWLLDPGNPEKLDCS